MSPIYPMFLSATPFAYIPHGHCYLWKTPLVSLHLLSDLAIALSYYSIPLILLYFCRQRDDLPFKHIFWWFGGFIVACGSMHLFEIWTLWHPDYWLSGSLKALTAVVSLATVSELVPVVPRALALPNPVLELERANQRLQEEIEERKRAEARVRQLNDNLQQRQERLTRYSHATLQLSTSKEFCHGDLRRAGREILRIATTHLELHAAKLLVYEHAIACPVGDDLHISLLNSPQDDDTATLIETHCLPILRYGERVGELLWAYAETDRRETPEDRSFLETLTALTALAIESHHRQCMTQQIQASLREKEQLLAELHHRVKNNLNVMANLLYLQGRSLSDESQSRFLQRLQQRISLMAMFHEQLYCSKDFHHIRLDRFLPHLLQTLLSLKPPNLNLNTQLQLEPLSLNLETALPCAIVVRELLANTLEHAFTGRTVGCITIKLHRDRAETIHLTVADDGIGFSLPQEATPSFGLHLVRLLGRQLQADLAWQTQGGTQCQLQFRELYYQPRVPILKEPKIHDSHPNC